MNILKCGRHVGSLNFFSTPAHAKSIGCDIFQIFLGNPQQILSKVKTDSELKNFSLELDRYDLLMVVHSSYTINLCHPINSKSFMSSVRSLVNDLRSSYVIGSRCLGVVIHMGKNVSINNITDDEAIKNYVKGVEQALETVPNSTIIFETGASQGTEVGSKMEDLGKIYHKINNKYKSRIKFCIDTCHIWATGYDLSNKKLVDEFFKKFDAVIGINKIALIHFNDSKNNLGSCVDRHQDLGFGMIPTDGLKYIPIVAKKNNIPIIMETPIDSINPQTNTDFKPSEEIIMVREWSKL